MTVIMVIAILATMLMPATTAIIEKMARAKCSMNLKTLYVATESYLQDQRHWPQIVVRENDKSETYAKEWMATLHPYGVSKESWHCPTVQKTIDADIAAKERDKEKERIDYFATPFDDRQMSPHAWAGQPWFIERGAVHGVGNLLIFPDGSIKSLDEIIAKGKKLRMK